MTASARVQFGRWASEGQRQVDTEAPKPVREEFQLRWLGYPAVTAPPSRDVSRPVIWVRHAKSMPALVNVTSGVGTCLPESGCRRCFPS
jgi:hypothetical protein